MIWNTVTLMWHHCDVSYSLQWHHNGRDSVWNHQPHDCLLNRLFRRRSKKTSKLRVTGLWHFVRGIHRGPVNSSHKWPVMWKMFPFDDVIILLSFNAEVLLVMIGVTDPISSVGFLILSVLEYPPPSQLLHWRDSVLRKSHDFFSLCQIRLANEIRCCIRHY